MRYDKLVRDRIPDIIIQNGGSPVYHKCNADERMKYLINKLYEEVDEFSEESNPEELIDILEVVYEIARFRGLSKKSLENLRKKKFDERGGFVEGVILEEA